MPGHVGPKDGTGSWYIAKHEVKLRRHPAVAALGDVDVSSTPPVDGDTLVWVDADKKWEPGAGGAGGDSNYRDRYALAGGGAQDVLLTFLPEQYSEHVYLNGLEQDAGNDWTRSGRTLSLLTAMGARTDDVVDVRYEYATGESLWGRAVTNGTQASPASTAWVAAGFPDATAYWIWDRATHTGDMSNPAGDVYFRKPLAGATGAARIFKCCDDTADVFLNGVLVPITNSLSAAQTADVTLTGDDWFAVKGNNITTEASVLLAVYALSGGTPTTLLLHTDGTWDCIGYPAAAPGGWPGPW